VRVLCLANFTTVLSNSFKSWLNVNILFNILL
jgi:hypothetical protein